ncbi:MAG: helix-turn-helix domain-containing protein [Actinobacteria bacterium]|nr:helix-turn-helix domain-containing protein [Actinomycetota bacterium]
MLHRWFRRYEQSGLNGLADRSHRPKTCAHQISPEVETAIASCAGCTVKEWGAGVPDPRRRLVTRGERGPLLGGRRFRTISLPVPRRCRGAPRIPSG